MKLIEIFQLISITSGLVNHPKVHLQTKEKSKSTMCLPLPLPLLSDQAALNSYLICCFKRVIIMHLLGQNLMVISIITAIHHLQRLEL